MFFTAIPGVTSEAWRTGQPAPYMVTYWDRSGKEPVLRKLDKWFVPDMKPAADLRKGDAAEFKRQRERMKELADEPNYMPGGA